MLKISNKGYLTEIFSSFQGEGGKVRGSCFGKRQIFIRFAGCNLVEGVFSSTGCFWCDSPHAQRLKKEKYKYEVSPNSQKFLNSNNPIEIKEIIKIIKQLITPDLHSISFTGGEPLYQLDFVLNLSRELRAQKINYLLYLETNGAINPDKDQFEELAKQFKYICCDIKDRSSKATLSNEWKKLVKTELLFIEKMVNLGVETFAKLVVTSQTQIQDIKYICKNLSKIKFSNGQIVGLAIQPVTLEKKELKERFSVSIEHLNNIFYAASEFLPPESLTLSVQVHKYLNLL